MLTPTIHALQPLQFKNLVLKYFLLKMKLISLTPCCCIGLLPYADSLVISLLIPEMELPSLSNSNGFNLLEILNGIILAITPQSTFYLLIWVCTTALPVSWVHVNIDKCLTFCCLMQLIYLDIPGILNRTEFISIESMVGIFLVYTIVYDVILSLSM